MDRVFEDVFCALSEWLREISTHEIRIENLETNFKRMLLQVQYEGNLSLNQMGHMEKICNLWLKLLKSDSKEESLHYLLQLFYHDQIALYTVIKIISKL